MKRRTIRMGATVLATAMLFAGEGIAQEKRLGEYIYVPAMAVQAQTGAISLRVEGIALGAESDDPVVTGHLSGAEFGVYVFSADGVLTPWADPLNPSEPMRIRTGEAVNYFTLPQGMEFYLRQESAPEGYTYEQDAIIAVDGEQIVITNAVMGELLLCAKNSLGEPLAGVTFCVTDENGVQTTLVSDENGEAVLVCNQPGVFSVSETALPEDEMEAIGVATGRESDVVAQEGQAISVEVREATRTRVEFEHPASGSVQLNMRLAVIDDKGEIKVEPLPGVVMTLTEGENQLVLTTDENGSAHTNLIEGMYTATFAYEGDATLPISGGQVLVESGSTTLIEFDAHQNVGRVVLKALSGKEIEGGSMTLTDDVTGKTFGPYAMDRTGWAISEPLQPGAYLMVVEAPENAQLGALYGDERSVTDSHEMVVDVSAGGLTEVNAQLLTRETQRYMLRVTMLGEDGEVVELALADVDTISLVDETGEMVDELAVTEGGVTVDALSGTYSLQLSEAVAKQLGVKTQSEAFKLPGEEGVIRFGSERTRLMLGSVDENGTPVTGAVYRVTDSNGDSVSVTTGESGRAVTPLMAAGNVTIETIQSPEGYDVAQTASIPAQADRTISVLMAHPSYGTASVQVSMQKLNDAGEVELEALPNVSVRIMDAQMTATVCEMTCGEDGIAKVQLEPGDYIALVSDEQVAGAYRLGEEVAFSIENTIETTVELRCYDVVGGVRASFAGGEMTQEALEQVRLELVAADGTAQALVQEGDLFYLGGVSEGTYTLRQTQTPQGYTPSEPREIDVNGGEVTEVRVPLVEYALVSVGKMGLTFDDDMRTFIVPLSGEYAVFTEENGEMKPYPSEEAQITVWSHITPEQIALGKSAQLELPADVDGTVYYLREIGGTAGFEQDETYHKLTLNAGDEMILLCGVVSKRGFFAVEELDAHTGEHVEGGAYELLDAQTLEVVHAFEMGETAYRNGRALPVGEYLLRQTKAAPGYALSIQPEAVVVIEPYLAQSDDVTPIVSGEGVTIAPYLSQNGVSQVRMTSVPLPGDTQMELLTGLYAAQEQGLTLLSVEADALETGETLILPQMTLMLDTVEGERLNIESVMLGGTTDGEGGAYAARVEYCLSDGGWQPSDARLTAALTEPVAVSLTDVKDDVCAIRVTYINAQTGEELAAEGFAPGSVTVDVRSDTEDSLQIHARAQFTGKYPYQQELGGDMLTIDRVSSQETTFETQGTGTFTTVSAGRDGTISGVAFLDENADGVMAGTETARYAGLLVSLATPEGEVLETCRTDAQGRYAFESLSGGTYVVQFEMGESVVFSYNDMYSIHATSRVLNARNGMSEPLTLDGDHTDYVVNAGCMYAAALQGRVVEMLDGVETGCGGLNIEMRRTDAGVDEEPSVVMTDELGMFSFGSILPGEYEVTVTVPKGYLCADAIDGRVTQIVRVVQGDQIEWPALIVEQEAVVSGYARVDEDGDGIVAGDAQVLAGVKATLMRVEDGQMIALAETTTDEAGAYAFDGLYEGTYCVSFELPEGWAFTQYGANSAVYGAAAGVGSTQQFEIAVGEHWADLDVGVTMPTSLTVAVFKDTKEYDGEKGYYEEWLEGVSLTLIRMENGMELQSIAGITDADGTATFDHLSPGEYVLAYEMPGAWRATKQIDPQTTSYAVSAVPQSAEPAGRSEPLTLSMQSEETMYIGAMLSVSVSGTMYYDDDANAKQGEAEAGCAGMLVELLDAEGGVIRTATTDENGAYAFDGLAPGRYRVQFNAPESCGFAATEYTMTRGGVQESDEHVATTRSISLESGESVKTADAGVVRLGGVSGVIWEDSDADCSLEEGEKPLAGVTVALMNSTARNILATTTTDENGVYTFANLRPNAYLIRVSAPDGYVFSGTTADGTLTLGDLRENRAYSDPFDLHGGTAITDAGFGLYTQGSIQGTVWQDKDYDGVKETGEAGLRSVELTLTDETGAQVAKTTSKRTGEYAFEGLKPGMYTMHVTLGEGYAFTQDGVDSAAPHTTQNTTSIALGELAMGQHVENVHIGALETASVNGVVWMDADNDGRRQNGDVSVPYARVLLTAVGGTDTGKVYETTIDSTGAYRFDGIMPGDYTLTFELGDGYAFARKATGTKRVSVVPQADALSAQSALFTVAAGDSVADMDAGVVGVGTLSGRIWQDNQYDGRSAAEEPGVEYAKIELIDVQTGETVKETASASDGSYRFEFVRVGEYQLRVTLPDGRIFTTDGESRIVNIDASVGTGEVFSIDMGESRMDLSVGAILQAGMRGSFYVDANENGVQDEGEIGLPGAQISLMEGSTAIMMTETDENGIYLMESIREGTYSIRVKLPENTLFSVETPLTLKHADATEGETAEIGFRMGETRTIEPLGVVKSATVAGVAWSDADADGVMDADEAPLSGTLAQLLKFEENGDSSVVGTAQVGSDGAYAFSLLRSGDYAVRFTLPQGMLLADHLEGEDTSSVPVVPGNIGQTQKMTLNQGDMQLDINVGGILPGEIGETVWKDSNGNGLQDYREPLVPGIEVLLLRVERDGTAQEAARTMSDQYGYYYFRELRPGTYIVRVETRPGDTLTAHFGEPLSEIDSDLDPDTGMSDEITLRSGEVIRNADIGFTELAE